MLQLAIAGSIDEIDAAGWDACAGGDALVSHAFFRALERSGAVGPGRRIQPQYVQICDAQGTLLAGAPAMLRAGTLAEYGPEHRWLKAGIAEGCFAWPKFQVGLPLYAVRGPKLLVRPGAPRETLRVLLIQGLKRLAVQRYGRPGMNLMHIDAELAAQLGGDGWLLSHELHAFWRNPGCADFAAWLGTLPHRKRYTIRRERRLFAELGLDIRLIPGDRISQRLLDAYYAGHQRVCLRFGNRPWLPPETLRCLVEEMPQAVRLLAAFDGGRYIAGAFWIVAGDALVLRTWSAFDERPGLCFELNCHRPIEFALENGLKYVDAGLTAAYKPQRGYADEAVASAHWFADPQLRRLAERELAALAAPPA